MDLWCDDVYGVVVEFEELFFVEVEVVGCLYWGCDLNYDVG